MAVSFTPQNSNKDTFNIDILVFYRGKRYKRTTGMSVPREYWLPKAQKCSENIEKFERGISINKALKRQKEVAEKAANHFTAIMQIPDQAAFFRKMDEYISGISSNLTFLNYADEYINRKIGMREHSSIKTYRSVINLIREYEGYKKVTLGFADINGDFYTGLQRFMYSGGSRGDKTPYSNNYFGRVVKLVKAIYNNARDQGLHSLPSLMGFAIEAKVPDSIYLTVEELTAMHNLELVDPTLRLVRAKFLFGAFTGLRVSDYNNLDEMDIGERMITVISKKTGKKVVSPINTIVRQQMGMVDITAPISDQEINRTIKEIARMAKITQPVKLARYFGGKRVITTTEKCDLVRSHTARRSFATNAFKAGVPAISIMKITGHTTERQFMKYIKISEEENAELMLGHEFFQ